ncbi:MAG TPA: universal stress protein [Gemmataceae bacterium]|nr:universal stress protein [Gemmataceae bacterium]
MQRHQVVDAQRWCTITELPILAIRNILHPTDFSDLSESAFQLACSLALDYGASLHVLHVSIAFEAYQQEKVFATHSDQYLAADWEKLGRLTRDDIEIQWHLEEGDPAEQILKFAAELNCDFIVMASNGRAFIGHYWAALLKG